VACVSGIRSSAVADRAQVIAECPPGAGHCRIELDRAPQRLERVLTTTCRGQHQSELVVHGAGCWLGSCEWLEGRERRGDISQKALRHADGQCCNRMAGNVLQDLLRLFESEG